THVTLPRPRSSPSSLRTTGLSYRLGARRRSREFLNLAGAPGIEPGMTGPKPVALPLGYAPPAAPGGWGRNLVRKPCRFPPAGEESAAALDNPGVRREERQIARIFAP